MGPLNKLHFLHLPLDIKVFRQTAKAYESCGECLIENFDSHSVKSNAFWLLDFKSFTLCCKSNDYFISTYPNFVNSQKRIKIEQQKEAWNAVMHSMCTHSNVLIIVRRGPTLVASVCIICQVILIWEIKNSQTFLCWQNYMKRLFE